MSFRRNLIIVVGHGLRSDALSDAETWPTHTPNLDKLIQRSLRLIGTSASPADPSSVMSLITGLHARQHGIKTLDQPHHHLEGFPAHLKEAGYHVAGVGAVDWFADHLDVAVPVADLTVTDPDQCAYLKTACQQGFLESVIKQRQQRTQFGQFATQSHPLEPDQDIDSFIAKQAAKTLNNMPADKPWALIVFFTGPDNHLPCPNLYADLNDTDMLGSNFVPANLSHINALAELDFPRVALQRLTRKKIGKMRQDYLGRVSLIDHGIGQILKVSKKRPDTDRIWSLITADRGCLLGEQGLVGNRSFLAPALEVPIIITPPTPVRPRSTDDLVSTVDIAATLSALAGSDLPEGNPGRSLLPLINGDELAAPFTGLISEFAKRLLLETERYKVVFDTENRQAIGLFDLLNDPDETQNLLNTPVSTNLLDALRWRLADTLMPLCAVSV
ncbi:MAG: sulfatase-like hydrolase/transferase [Phycisphaeraceae bacterium]|nr:sulfatase-like hydrolase/transferase [Phycisphaeraceae bacterium]